MSHETQNGASAPLRIEADVLVIGGGMAACWAAISAARAGAEVVLVDKGYVGTSGVTATAGPGHWWVSPEGNARKEAVEKRLITAHGLADRGWMERIIDTTWRTLPTLSPYYRFDTNDRGETVYNALRGPEYLRALRHATVDAGVKILDQSPVLELSLHDDGSAMPRPARMYRVACSRSSKAGAARVVSRDDPARSVTLSGGGPWSRQAGT
jgi:succinate dehydrogenase/fumarate reductase flavoprotein subunit